MSAPPREPETWCENCGDAFSAPERDCPRPSPGRPYADCGRGGHMFRLTASPFLPGAIWRNDVGMDVQILSMDGADVLYWPTETTEPGSWRSTRAAFTTSYEPVTPAPRRPRPDRIARGPSPRSRVSPPEVGQRCPRCHRRRVEEPTLPCALCAPHLVPGAGALFTAGFRVEPDRRPIWDRRDRTGWVLRPGLGRAPSLAQAIEILEMMDAVFEHGPPPDPDHQYKAEVRCEVHPDGQCIVSRCECGHPAFNDDVCKLCRALASVHPVVAADAHDLECRYQAAERFLDRVAAVVAALKERLQAVPLGGVQDADFDPSEATGEPQQPPRDA